VSWFNCSSRQEGAGTRLKPSKIVVVITLNRIGPSYCLKRSLSSSMSCFKPRVPQRSCKTCWVPCTKLPDRDQLMLFQREFTVTCDLETVKKIFCRKLASVVCQTIAKTAAYPPLSESGELPTISTKIGTNAVKDKTSLDFHDIHAACSILRAENNANRVA
jgi:hypothetical protein